MTVVDVVDGMNVIGSRPTGWWRDRDRAVRDLYERLARAGGPFVLVLDGRPVSGVPSLDPAGCQVEVHYAERSGPNAADDKIVSLVEASPAPGRLRVVTSDRDLRARVEALGASTGSPRRFLADLDE